jgi:hypothetical protein
LQPLQLNERLLELPAEMGLVRGQLIGQFTQLDRLHCSATGKSVLDPSLELSQFRRRLGDWHRDGPDLIFEFDRW